MIGSVVPLQLVRELAQRHLHPRLQRERQAGALVHQGRDRDPPAVVDPADDVLDRDPRLFDEELVELGLAGDLDQRPDLDAVLLHVHQEVGEPAVLGRVRVRAGEQHAPLGVMRERRPDLLAGDDVLVALEHRAGLQATRGRSPSRARRSPGTTSRPRTGSAPGSAPSGRRCRARSRSARPSSGRARWPSAARASGRTPRTGSPARSASRPEPPYSVGHVRPAQPRSFNLRCQSRRNWNEASSPSGSRPGWLSAIHDRSVSRNSSSAGESVRSTRRKLTRCQQRRVTPGRAPVPRPARPPAWAARRSPRRRGSARARPRRRR